MDNENQGNGLVAFFAFVLGCLVGSTLGLLFAPLAGRETQERIRDVSTDVKKKTIDTAHTARATTTEMVTGLVSKGKARLNDATESVKSAVEAGKTAFVEKTSELENTLSREKNEEESNTTKKKSS